MRLFALSFLFLLFTYAAAAQKDFWQNETLTIGYDKQVWKSTPSKDPSVWLDLRLSELDKEADAPRYTVKAQKSSKFDLKEAGQIIEERIQAYQEAKVIQEPMWVEAQPNSYWQYLLLNYADGTEQIVNVRLYYHNGYLIEIIEQGRLEYIERFNQQLESLRNRTAFR